MVVCGCNLDAFFHKSDTLYHNFQEVAVELLKVKNATRPLLRAQVEVFLDKKRLDR